MLNFPKENHRSAHADKRGKGVKIKGVTEPSHNENRRNRTLSDGGVYPIAISDAHEPPDYWTRNRRATRDFL